jgi:dTMP kinase
MGAAFHQTLRAAFRNIAAREPERCVLIDAEADIDAVAARVWETVAAALDIFSSG